MAPVQVVSEKSSVWHFKDHRRRWHHRCLEYRHHRRRRCRQHQHLEPPEIFQIIMSLPSPDQRCSHETWPSVFQQPINIGLSFNQKGYFSAWHSSPGGGIQETTITKSVCQIKLGHPNFCEFKCCQLKDKKRHRKSQIISDNARLFIV